MRSFFGCVVALIISILSVVAQEKPYVILVSFDGFRYDYVQRFDLPNFKSFIEKGSHAEALIPSFPSKTGPNHYTLVTGLYPGHHGLVGNQFFDPSMNSSYSMKVKGQARNPEFYGGKPLWKLAADNGLKSASYFWVGSEIPDEGWHPDYYYPYDESVPFPDRVDQVLSWLKLPVAERPRFITLYFSSPDKEAHLYGPVAEETKEATRNVDAMLGRLMNGLETINLPVNVILVSDHGLKELEVQEKTYIFLDEVLDLNHSGLKVINGGTQAHFYTRDEVQTDSLYRVLKQKAQNYFVLKRSEFLKRWNYDHERSGDIMMMAHPGYYIREKERAKFMQTAKIGSKFGEHGYDPHAVKEMHGIFYAQGPNIKPGLVLPPFENIHIYPFIANILKLPLPKIDGDPAVLNPLLHENSN